MKPRRKQGSQESSNSNQILMPLFEILTPVCWPALPWNFQTLDKRNSDNPLTQFELMCVSVSLKLKRSKHTKQTHCEPSSYPRVASCHSGDAHEKMTRVKSLRCLILNLSITLTQYSTSFFTLNIKLLQRTCLGRRFWIHKKKYNGPWQR